MEFLELTSRRKLAIKSTVKYSGLKDYESVINFLQSIIPDEYTVIGKPVSITDVVDFKIFETFRNSRNSTKPRTPIEIRIGGNTYLSLTSQGKLIIYVKMKYFYKYVNILMREIDLIKNLKDETYWIYK